MAKDKANANTLELYKLEYETAAARYQNIYTALWQNFSYIVVVSGAILTFSKDTLGIYISGFLACLPLLFWYWATFVPLNRYGDEVGRRLAEIEKTLNADFETNLKLFIKFDERRRATPPETSSEKPPEHWKLPVIGICGIFFGLVFLSLMVSVFLGSHPFFDPEHRFNAASGVRIVVFLIAISGLAWAVAFFSLRNGKLQSSSVRGAVNIGAMILHLVVMTLPLLWMLHAEKVDVFAIKLPTSDTVIKPIPPDLKTQQEEQATLKQIQKDTDAIKKKLKIQ